MLNEPPPLSDQERQRYKRHISLPDVGEAGQAKLRSTSVIIVGAGGLGAPVIAYLAAAGVRSMLIVDDDRLDLSNLQRQVIYKEANVGWLKSIAAKEFVHTLNASVQVLTYPKRLRRASEAEALLNSPHLEPNRVVLDCTDNVATRYVLNAACVSKGVPMVSAAVQGHTGQVSVFCARGGPCYACLYHPTPPSMLEVPDASPGDGGVLGVLTGMMGCLQATEAMKLILGLPEPLIGRLLLVDAMRPSFDILQVPRRKACMACAPSSDLPGGTRTPF